MSQHGSLEPDRAPCKRPHLHPREISWRLVALLVGSVAASIIVGLAVIAFPEQAAAVQASAAVLGHGVLAVLLTLALGNKSG